MTVENAVRLLAGTFVGISLLLYYFISPWYLLIAAFVSLNLIQSVFTKFCLAEIILKKIMKRS